MASPFLAKMALGYMKQKNAQAQSEFDRQLSAEHERAAMDLEVEKQRKLQDLALETLKTKTTYLSGINAENNAVIAKQYENIARTTTDPGERKRAEKWSRVYAGAGDLETNTVEIIGNNLTPDRAEQKTVQDREFERKERNQKTFGDKMSQLAQVPLDQLEAMTPQQRQQQFIHLAQGLDKEYVDELKDVWTALLPKEATQKMPDYLKNADMQYRQRGRDYINLITSPTKDTDVNERLSMELELNNLAETLNDWAEENGQQPMYKLFVDDDNDPSTPAVSQSPQEIKRKNKEGAAFIKAREGLSQTPKTAKSWMQRAEELRKEFPQDSPTQILKKLEQEGIKVTR